MIDPSRPSGMLPQRPRVLHLTTESASANMLMTGQLSHLRQHGFDVAVAASPGDGLRDLEARESVAVFPVSMQREISPARDAVSLRRLVHVIRQFRPHIVNAGTPKAGLLGMVAARLTKVPIRIYTLRGLRLETASGWKRSLLTQTERISCAAADTVLCVSPSLRDRAAQLRLTAPSKLTVLASGSSNGVRAERFAATPTRLADAARLAEQHGLPEPNDHLGRGRVVGFVGRLTRDKGIAELAAAFQLVKRTQPDARLLLMGGFESGDPVAEHVRRQLIDDPAVTITGFVQDVAPYYHLMGQCVLPSYREGFPNVALEAAASGLPVIAFDATGSRDSLVDGTTGRLVRKGDIAELASAISDYIAQPLLRARHGRAGRGRVETEFRPQIIWNALIDLYSQRLREAVPAASIREPDLRPAIGTPEVPQEKRA